MTPARPEVVPAAEVVPASRDRLGECPVWDDRAATLWRVDAVAGTVLSLDVGAGVERTYEVGGHVGSLVLRADGQGLLLAAGDGFHALDTGTGVVTPLAVLPPGRTGVVLNDGACDPAGRFVAGTMRLDAGPGGSALHRYAPPDGTVRLVEGPGPGDGDGRGGLSNGLAWDAAGTTLFWVDTLLARVERLGYDPAAGTVTSRAPFLDLRGLGGLPDGLAVDVEDCLWVAFWRGGAVRRFSPDGRLLAEVALPVLGTTSCCFGGDDLRDLYVTTARQSLRDLPAQVEPLAGAVLRFRVDVPGLPTSRWVDDAAVRA